MLALVRLYTYNTPIAKGKYRLQTVATGLCRHLPADARATTKDGRRLFADLSTGMTQTVYFLGEYESDITDKVVTLVREGDTCIDAGANFGWYTTLLRKLCGDSGAVHAFEPVPASYRELERNYKLMGSPGNVVVNQAALGDEEKTLTINLFKGLPTGHASLSDHGRDDAVRFECRMTTLDGYLERNGVGQVDFVKVDIEGAEMMFLKGAGKLFEQEVAPVILMEMAVRQTSTFGYKPDDLVQYLAGKADYDFYAVDEMTREVKKIEGFAADHIGANVFCIPKAKKFLERPLWMPR